jgi:hypothetical protein
MRAGLGLNLLKISAKPFQKAGARAAGKADGFAPLLVWSFSL